ncbi:MAG: helix-turn-helix domain-containing protein [Kiloniellales bacterium]|nr:helix-turn-helix domain-containing protein [Kiloniellales bacterium]
MQTTSAVEITRNAVVPHAGQLQARGEAANGRQPSCITSLQCYQPKDVIFYQGDPCEHLFEVVEGVVKLYKLTPDGRRQVTGFLYPGQFLGLGWNELYTQTAEAVSGAKLCRYPHAKLDEWLTLYPALGRRLLSATTTELVLAQDQMLLLGRKTARERIASFLVRLLERQEDDDDPSDEIYLPMIRADIADFLGLTAETVSRVLGRLRDCRIIEIPDHGCIQVCDRDRLEELAEGDEDRFLD